MSPASYQWTTPRHCGVHARARAPHDTVRTPRFSLTGNVRLQFELRSARARQCHEILRGMVLPRVIRVSLDFQVRWIVVCLVSVDVVDVFIVRQ
jgi:hypothetical protein